MTDRTDETLTLRADEVIWREVGDELVVLEIATTTYLTLNGSGRCIWEELVSGTTVDDLVRLVAGRYGIAEHTARADVDAFIADLDGRSLLERAG